MVTIYVDLDEVRCPLEEVDDYIKMMNGIALHCEMREGYIRGWRNEKAVDLTVGSYMLGLEPIEVLDEFREAMLINDEDDDENPADRVWTVYNYKYAFDWLWMIDPEFYVRFTELYQDDLSKPKLKFVVKQ